MMPIASSSDCARMTLRTGPKTSSWAISMSGVTPSRMVGPTNDPRGSAPELRPSTASAAPAARPFSIQPRMRSRAAVETTGPTSTPCSRPSPTANASVCSLSSGISAAWASPTVITTDPAMQRWPAAPNAEPRILDTVFGITASGITTMKFLAPPSACTRLPAAAARSYT
jgi:hypothetical protein